MKVYRDFDEEAMDREYRIRETVAPAEFEAAMAGYAEISATMRQRLEVLLDQSFGPSADEVMDRFWSEARVRTPSGGLRVPGKDENGALVLAAPKEVGVYEVVLGGETLARLPVALLNAGESRLKPREKISFGEFEVAVKTEMGQGTRHPGRDSSSKRWRRIRRIRGKLPAVPPDHSISHSATCCMTRSERSAAAS